MIHFFCALPCEAQPIIQHFKLTELKQFDLFRIYQSKDKQGSLTITGIGKLNASAAVSYHHACLNTSADNIWLNVGVAGHASIQVGEARLINKITDNQCDSCWYPQILFKPPCDSTSLLTLDNPSTDYQDALFDMEASGFYQMALRLGTAELIHCLKIISDNNEQPTSTINADNVKKMISAHTGTIDSIPDSLKPFATDMASIIKEPEHYQKFIELWHFTQSERIQLSRLLRQWTVRYPNEDIMQSITDLKTGKSVLSELKNKLTESEFIIYD
ncbi:MAG: hypothetical protein O7D86_09090 [Proteobacteria bacterium]|nr:hypothetical protein [Pseudomonadota bacterium]